jgi:hypothetical protein
MSDINFVLRVFIMKTLAKILENPQVLTDYQKEGEKVDESKKVLDLQRLDGSCDIVWEKMKDELVEICKDLKQAKNKKGQKIKSIRSEYSFFLEERKEKLKRKYPGIKKKELTEKFNKCLPTIEKKWLKLKEADKVKYNNLCIKDKERYFKEL